MNDQPALAGINIRQSFPKHGSVAWLSVRPERGQPVKVVDEVLATVENGLQQDRFNGKPGAERQVSLIQYEHLSTIAKLLDRDEIDPALTRRNIAVQGISLTALKGCEFQIGEAIFLGTGACAPCSKMERALGHGGFNAMRGHGGIVAAVLQAGKIRIGDSVKFLKIKEREQR